MRTHHFVMAALALPLLVSGAGKVEAVNKDGNGLALRGFDAVAYFVDGRAVPGSSEFTHRWAGAAWNFASAAHRDAFAANPVRYAPQFGGYCAWAVSNNYTAPVDPEAWKIVDGRLYLNYNKKVQENWQKDLTKRIEAGERNWPGLHN